MLEDTTVITSLLKKKGKQARNHGNQCQNSYHIQRGQIPAWIITRPIYDMQLERQTD